MHRAALLLALTLFTLPPAAAQDAPPLSTDELKAIAAKPHDDQPVLKGLEVFPTVRTWDASGHFIDPAGKRDPFKGKTTSKRVDGKYVVDRTTFEGLKVALTFVVTWDPKSDLYYKYTVPGRGQPSRSIGMRVPNTRAIAWVDAGQGGVKMITVETYDDDKMSWHSKMLDKAGAATLTTEGAATAARE
jgi:hypothetical protein